LNLDKLKTLAASEGLPGWQLYKDVDKLREKLRAHRESLDVISG